MNDNPSPFELHTDEHLEARITAYILGESSAFEAAEIEDLISKSPELKLFANRTRALNELLKEAETTSNTPDAEWKLSGKKRAALNPAIGPIHILTPLRENRIRRASFRAAWGIAAIFVVTLFTLRLLPSDYEAEAVIEIKPRQNPIDPLGGAISGSPNTAAYFGTEFEKIKSRNTLSKVVDNLDLTNRWNTDKETAIKRLKENVETSNIRGSDLISIRVRDASEQDAKAITREIANSYSDYRNELAQRTAAAAVSELSRAVRAQEDKVEERRQTLAGLSRSQAHVYKSAAASRESSKKEAVEANIDTKDYVNAQYNFETDQALLQTMKLQLINEELNSGLSSKIESINEPRIVSKPFSLFKSDSATKEKAIAANSKQPSRPPAPPTAAPAPAMTLGEAIADAGGASADEKEDVARAPKPPTSAMSRAIAANTANPVAIPVPDVNVPTPSADFGDGADFGGGWGDASGGGGGFTGKENDESLAMNESSFRSNSAAYSGPLGGALIPEAPPAPAITAGNRSGDATINRNNIDAILNNPDRTAQEGKQMEELQALRKELVDSPADLSHELKGLAMKDRNEPMDGDETLGTRALGLESQKALSETDADPFAEPGGISGLAQREVIRRQESVAEADRQLVEGREAYEKGDYQQASEKFDQALSQLPDSPALEDRRSAIADHLGIASLATAQQMRKVGKYDEARDMLEKAAAAGGENQEEIKTELAYLDDPIRTNPALTYEHTKNVDEVRRKLYMAQGNFDLGNFDEAKKTFEETLRIDPFNKAARRGMEKVEAAKSDYYRAAYDHTRTELLSQVDKAWELEVPADLIAKDKELEFDALAESKEYGYRMDTRAGSERLAADEPMKMNDLFSSSSLGQAADIRWGGLKNDLSAYGDADELDLYAGNADRTTFDAYQAPQMNGRFDGFMNFGSPIQLKGNKETKDMVIRREVPLMPNFFFDTPDDASVITRSGAAANLGVIREFIYPTEFEAPEVDEVPQLEDLPVTGRLFKEKPIDLADLSNEIPATQEPFSTFSLNISDASFQVASSAVAKGERPDPESIKPEQFYNAVPYDDPAPSTGEPVAATIGQVAHPVIPGRNLVRMSVRTASTGRAATQPLVLTLLVDQSGSMARADRRAAMDTALTQLATLMQPDDRITVIGFSRTANLLADSLPGNDAAKLPDIINQASSEGGTNIEQALNLAENLALRHKQGGAQNRIVLFTDGAANLGNADPERLAGRVKSLRQQDLAFDIAGIGTDDINDRLLSELARHGNGRYYLVGENTGDSLAKQLAGAFRPAAENVKIQVKFNPQRVGNYKLIGFEKDRLKTEDFRNDAVDAAELAADESGTALYQVEPLADGSGEIGELFVRFRDTATGEMVERSWTIPYESQAPAIDKAQPPMQLAALSMLAAQKLQTGPLADAINFRDLAPTIAAVKQAYAHSPQAQQMVTLINALK